MTERKTIEECPVDKRPQTGDRQQNGNTIKTDSCRLLEDIVLLEHYAKGFASLILSAASTHTLTAWHILWPLVNISKSSPPSSPPLEEQNKKITKYKSNLNKFVMLPRSILLLLSWTRKRQKENARKLRTNKMTRFHPKAPTSLWREHPEMVHPKRNTALLPHINWMHFRRQQQQQKANINHRQGLLLSTVKCNLPLSWPEPIAVSNIELTFPFHYSSWTWLLTDTNSHSLQGKKAKVQLHTWKDKQKLGRQFQANTKVNRKWQNNFTVMKCNVCVFCAAYTLGRLTPTTTTTETVQTDK